MMMPEMANGKAMEVQEVLVINLTAHGLEDKTVEELDEMFHNGLTALNLQLVLGNKECWGRIYLIRQTYPIFDIANNSFLQLQLQTILFYCPKLKLGATYTVSMLEAGQQTPELANMHVDVKGKNLMVLGLKLRY